MNLNALETFMKNTHFRRKPRAQAGERKKRKKESSSDADDSDAHSEEV